MAWQQLSLTIAATELAQAEALLRLAGASAIAISDDSDTPILEPEPGSTPVWPKVTLRALFDATLDLGSIDAIFAGNAPGAITIESIDDDDLNAAMRQRIDRLEIGPRLTIVPAEEFEPGDAAELGLHMGLAFGTGQHPTTRLCLEWLERNMRPMASVLDYGCGTGVLALAALRLGAGQAWAVDTEPQALEATAENARLNGLDTRVETGPPEDLPSQQFELVLANILAQPLTDLAELLAARQDAGGTIVLSGILVSQLDELASHYARWYEELEQSELDGWGLLTGRRRNGYDR